MEQSFTAEFLLEIYDGFNRSARRPDDEIHPELIPINSTIQSRRKAVKNFQAKNAHYKKYPASVQRMHEALKDNLRRKYADKRKIVNDLMVSLASRIRSNDFRVNFSRINVKGKAAYSCGGDVASRYCLKAISYHIRKIYKVRPSSRDYINHQLKNYLSDGFPYRVIRADISSFFESIPHKALIDKITQSGLLSSHSQKIIRRMLADYVECTSGPLPHRGVPRGLSLSSDLAELYMKPFDDTIKNTPGVVFYSRYVDDIVIIVAHDNTTRNDNLSSMLSSECLKHGLQLNASPQKNLNTIWQGAPPPTLSYLGFEHKIDGKQTNTDISAERFDRYKRRISVCFDAYYCRGTTGQREAGKWLERRLKFLTTNTRLEFSKELAHTGVYFNNSIISDTSVRLKGLDKFLQKKLAELAVKEPGRINLHAKLKKIDFHKGYRERKYSSYTSRKGGLRASMLKEITDIWIYD